MPILQPWFNSLPRFLIRCRLSRVDWGRAEQRGGAGDRARGSLDAGDSAAVVSPVLPLPPDIRILSFLGLSGWLGSEALSSRLLLL